MRVFSKILCSGFWVVILLLQPLPLYAGDTSLWPCLVESQKGSSIYYTDNAATLEKLTKELIPLGDYELQMSTGGNKGVLSYVGEIRGRKIYDITYPAPPDDYYGDLKAMVVQREDNLYTPVHYTFDAPGIDTLPSRILIDKNLVVKRTNVEGSGGIVTYFYLYIPVNGIPHQLDTSIINTIIEERVPKGMYVNNGNPFDIDTLLFDGQLEGADPHCCPTGGEVKIQFKLIEDSLRLVSYTYIP